MSVLSSCQGVQVHILIHKLLTCAYFDLQFTSACFLRSAARPNWLHNGDPSFPSQRGNNPQTLPRQKSDLTLTKGSAAQYYLSKARYSPSSTTNTTHQRGPSGQSHISAQNKAAFGSTQPRFGYLGNPESSAFKKHPSASVLPSLAKPAQGMSGHRAEGAMGAGGSWRTAGMYPSISASTTKSTYPGRTDWRAK